MNYLITGAAGFLGSALANQLANDGHLVRGLDDLSSGDTEKLSNQVHFTKSDVNERAELWNLLQDVDCVYHLAAKVLVAESILYPREYNHVNVSGTVSVMEAMRDVGVKRVVFISSGAVYGYQEEQPINESALPKPSSPYAVSKLAAENYVNTIGDHWGIETVSLRVFNAYGPGQSIPASHAPLVPNFLWQGIRGGSLVVYGDGQQTRDFVYVDDVVNAMILAGTATNIDKEVINIGSGKETSVISIAEQVNELTKNSAGIILTKNHPGESRVRANIYKAKKKLNFTPKIGFKEGLRLTLGNDPRFHIDR
jgi:UDP-glucose 4-epimerase